MNPEMTSDFLWEFLLLRTTVAINYSLLCEIDKVCILVVNLIKFVMLGTFPLECLEIIDKLLQNDLVYSLKELEGISFSGILLTIKPVLVKQIQNASENDCEKFAHLFQNMEKIVNLISSKYQVADLDGFRLFEAVI
jgi:hypothetical protein